MIALKRGLLVAALPLIPVMFVCAGCEQNGEILPDGSCSVNSCLTGQDLVDTFPVDRVTKKIDWEHGDCRCVFLGTDPEKRGKKLVGDTCTGTCPNPDSVSLLCFVGNDGKPDKEECYCMCL